MNSENNGEGSTVVTLHDEGTPFVPFLSSATARTGLLPSSEYASCLSTIEGVWRSEQRASTIRQYIQEFLQAADNPYEIAVYLVDKCSDANVKKGNTLACIMAKEIEKWIVSKGADVKHKLTSALKKKAFDSATRSHLLFFDAFCSAMDFRSSSLEFLSEVQGLVAKDLTGACLVIGRLGLQEHFELRTFAVPLIARERISDLEHYVEGAPAQQLSLVRLFDSFCAPGFKAKTLLDDYPGVKSTSTHLKKKVLAKHGLRLMKKYGIAPDECEHTVDFHSMSAVRYLMHRYFEEKSMSLDAFCELLVVTARDRPRLCEEVAHQLFVFKKTSMAAQWARHYHLLSERLPAEVASILPLLPDEETTGGSWQFSQLTTPLSVCEDYIDDQTPEYYSLSLPLTDVEMVRDTQGFITCTERIVASGGPVGIDCEWMPSFCSVVDQPLSIVQLAVATHVWILDMSALSVCLSPSDWSLLKQIFNNPGVIKLGFGFSEDFRKLASTLPGFSSTDLVGFIDLMQLYSDIQAALTHDQGTHACKGLTDVVRLTLGKALDKREQMSNWERRPLRSAQLQYAALDAFCLLAVFAELTKQAKDAGIDAELQPTRTAAITTSKKSATARAKQAKNKGSADHGAGLGANACLDRGPIPAFQALPRALVDPAYGSSVDTPVDSSSVDGPPGMRATALRLVVDSMLQGLGKKLRSLGIDTLITGNDDDREEVAKLCLRQTRTLLSAGEPYRRFCQLLPQDLCVIVDHTLPAEKQVDEVLEHFSVQLTAADILSRCQACNNGSYILVPGSAMAEMCLRRAALSQVSGIRPAALVGGVSSVAEVADAVDYENACLSTGVSLQLDSVQQSTLKTVDFFRVCALCGKVFWEGSHHRNMARLYSSKISSGQGIAGQGCLAGDAT